MQISENDNDSANSLRSTWFFMSMFFVCGSYGKSEGRTKAAPRSNEKTRERGVRKKALCPLPPRFVVWPRLAAHIFNFTSHKRKAHLKNLLCRLQKKYLCFSKFKGLFLRIEFLEYQCTIAVVSRKCFATEQHLVPAGWTRLQKRSQIRSLNPIIDASFFKSFF